MALYVVHCDLTVVVWQSDNRWWREYFLLLKSDDYLCSSSEILGIQHDDPVCLTYSSLWTSSLQKQSFDPKQRTFNIPTAGRRQKLVLSSVDYIVRGKTNLSLPNCELSRLPLLGADDICYSLSPELRTSDSATLRMCSVREHSRTESRPPQQRLYAPDSWSLSPGELI